MRCPLPISRLIPGEIARQSVEDLTQRISPRRQFLEMLTETELELAEVLKQQPYASNHELGEGLGKTSKTIENQFSTIYSKMQANFDIQVNNKHKRQALIDIMQGKV